jgi:amidohydrolase
VYLLFQPAEENGQGAEAMLADKIFEEIRPDRVFALHNLPGYQMNNIVIKEKEFTASVNSILIDLKGKTSHAAEPENGINPALAIAQILQECLALANNDIDSPDMRVITPVYLNIGEKAYGISAGEGCVHLTLRCWNDGRLKELERSVEATARQIAVLHHLESDISYTQTFHANMNNPEAVHLVKEAAAMTDLKIEMKQNPFKWGEDFGLFTSRFPGCMFGLGSGEKTPALHNPDYDFPDELIVSGRDIFVAILHKLKHYSFV